MIRRHTCSTLRPASPLTFLLPLFPLQCSAGKIKMDRHPFEVQRFIANVQVTQTLFDKFINFGGPRNLNNGNDYPFL
jgi:hypothetical protein